MPDLDDKEPTSEQEILAQARKDFAHCQEGERQARDEYSRCMRFIALDQYPETGAASKNDRASAGLPSLVVDQCNPCANQIINDWIRNRMGIQIGPADSIASQKTAKIFTGYVRNLEYISHARMHYDRAFRNLVWGGRGYIGLLTRRKKGTFRQELYIRGFPDSQAVYMDPYSQEIDLSDNNITFVRQVISKEQFKAEFPGEDFDSDFSDWGADYADWTTKDGGGVIAEYWKAKYLPRKVQKLTHAIPIQRGSRTVTTDEVYDDEYNDLPKGVDVAKDPENGGARMEEDEPKRVIVFRKMTGKNVLQETEWLGRIIPIYPMIAKAVYVDGQKRIFSAISGGLDPQCQVNYAESNIAAEMGSETYVPWVGALGQFKSQRQAWQDLNIVRRPFIEYDVVAVGDKLLAPPPSKPTHEPQIVAFAHASDRAQNNFRTATGINRSNLGIEDAKAKSGVAINALKSEGDNSTFDFPDAGTNCMQLLGDGIVEVWPKIATKPEIIQILNDEEEEENVLINADPSLHPNPPNGQVDAHFIDQGEYRVRVKAAPTAQTLMENTQQTLTTVYSEATDAQKAVILGPLIRSMPDFIGKEAMAERVEPPEYKKSPDGAPAIPPEAQAVITQGQQLIQAANAHIAQLEKERDAKILELENKLQQEAIKGDWNVEIARIGEEAKTGRTLFEGEIKKIQGTLDMITSHLQIGADMASQESAQAHQADMATQAQQAQAAQASAAAQQQQQQPTEANGQ